MENSSMIHVLVDKDDKEKAIQILKNEGYTMSSFIRELIQQIIKENGIPFEYNEVELNQSNNTSN